MGIQSALEVLGLAIVLETVRSTFDGLLDDDGEEESPICKELVTELREPFTVVDKAGACKLAGAVTGRPLLSEQELVKLPNVFAVSDKLRIHVVKTLVEKDPIGSVLGKETAGEPVPEPESKRAEDVVRAVVSTVDEEITDSECGKNDKDTADVETGLAAPVNCPTLNEPEVETVLVTKLEPMLGNVPDEDGGIVESKLADKVKAELEAIAEDVLSWLDIEETKELIVLGTDDVATVTDAIEDEVVVIIPGVLNETKLLDSNPPLLLEADPVVADIVPIESEKIKDVVILDDMTGPLSVELVGLKVANPGLEFEVVDARVDV
jgi:hypothetical protein